MKEMIRFQDIFCVLSMHKNLTLYRKALCCINHIFEKQLKQVQTLGSNSFSNRKNKLEMFNKAIVLLDKWHLFMSLQQTKDPTVDVFLTPLFEAQKKQTRNAKKTVKVLPGSPVKTWSVERSRTQLYESVSRFESITRDTTNKTFQHMFKDHFKNYYVGRQKRYSEPMIIQKAHSS